MAASQRDSDSGDRRLATLRSLITTYSRPLTRYFERHARSRDDVPDLVQEVFLRLARVADPAAIDQRDGFIFVTASNVLRDEARRGKVRGVGHALPIDGMTIASSDFAPDRVLEGRQAAQRIRDALLDLPERTRDVFVLRMLEGWRMADVARSLGISTRAAEKHQARALAHLATRLQAWRDD